MRSRSPALQPTGLLLVAALLAFALVGWRATLLFSPQPAEPMPAGTSLLEQRLTGLVSTVLGPGEAQVHQSIRPDGSRALLVLVNDRAKAGEVPDEALLDLVSEAVFIDTLAGDTVNVRRMPFAAERGFPSQGEMLELAGLAGLSLLLAGLVVLSRAGAPQTSAERAPARPVQAAPSMASGLNTQLVARRIGEDPGRAADVIRGWLRHGMGEA